MTDASQSSAPLSRGRLGTGLTAGVDVGTTSVKAVVVDGDGTIIERVRLASGLVAGPLGRFEHDAVATWWDAPRTVLSRLLSLPRTADQAVEAVAVSSMMPSVAAVDATGRPLGPGLLYGDRRASAGGPPAGGPADEGPTGGDPTASNEMARLAGWAAANAPGAKGVWPAQAVANASLGGEGVIDLASAFATGSLFNGSGWAEEACASAGLSPAQMPRVAMFGEAVGHVRPQATAGPPVPVGRLHGGMVLGAGSVDGLCEQLVAGAVEDGDVLVAFGSTLVVWLCVPGWPDEVPGLWRAPHLAGGKAIVGGASNAGGMWADWVDRVVRPEDGDAGGPGQPGPAGPSDVPLWWPWARGERVPWHDPDLRIGLAGADLSHGPGALRRAGLEAGAFVVRHIAELASTTGTSPKRFIVSGGGAANPAWLQALADVLAQPVFPLAVPEAAALGAAFLARMAAGMESSLDEARRWARWAAPVNPRSDWARAAGERYRIWAEGLPGLTRR